MSPLFSAIVNNNVLEFMLYTKNVGILTVPLYANVTPLCLCIKQNNNLFVKILIDLGIDPKLDYSDVAGVDILSLAVSNGNIDIVEMLLKQGLEIDSDFDVNDWTGEENSPVLLAKDSDNTEIYDLLISYGGQEVSDTQFSKYMSASYRRHLGSSYNL